MIKHKVLLALLIVFTSNLFSQVKLEIDSDAISKFLNQYVSGLEPGMAVGIVKDGQISYEHYLGYANLAHEVKVDKDTRFNIASCAKQYTALCILKLVEAGALKLEEDVRKYLPDLFKTIPDKISIADLIAHTSGVRDIHHLWSLKGLTWYELFLDNGDAIELLKGQKALNFKPGTEHSYSNSNYVLLAAIVKKVTDQNFNKFATTLFEELDMPNTSFLSNRMAIVPHRARPYAKWNGWKEYPYITEIHADGGLFTTLGDQLKWEQIIHANDGKYLSKEVVNESQKRIAFDYGYGLEFNNRRGLDYTYHNGSTGAYHATFLRFPQEKLSIVLMSNNGSIPSFDLAWKIAYQILGLKEEKSNIIHPGNPETIEGLTSLQDLLGAYKGEGADGTIIRISEKDGALYREIYRRDPSKLINKQGALFEYENIKGLKMNFTNIGKPNQQFTLYISTQAPSIYRKLPDSNLDNFDKKELNGRFYNEETDTEIILQYMEDNTYTLTKNGRARKAELILKDYLRMMSSYEFRIIRDQENKIIGLTVDNDRIRNVRFDKT